MGWFSKPPSQLNFFAQREQERLEAVNKALKGPFGDNQTLYANTKALLEAARLPDPTTFCKRVGRRFIQRCDERGIALPYHDLGFQMLGAAAALYAAERLTDLPPNPAAYSNFGDTAVIGQMRDLLLHAQRKLALPNKTLDTLENSITDCLVVIASYLPPLAQESDNETNAAMMMPLIDLLPDVGRIIEDALTPFDTPEVREAGLFRWLQAHIKENAQAASAGAKNLIAPSQYRATPQEIAATFLKDTPLYDIFIAKVPFSLPQEQRFAGHWMIAPPGRGKTTLLHTLVVDDLEKDAAVVLMDSKGDLIEPIKNLASIKDRLLLIEPNPDAAFALNPLDVSHTNVMQAVGLIEYIMAGLLDAKFTALQSTLFRNVVPAIIEAIPNPTLYTFKEVMVRGLPSLDKLNPHARQFFENRETGFNSKTYDSTRKEVVWRLDYLLTNPVMRTMFSATHTRLDLGKEMDAGKVIIINNSKAILGDEGAEFFGRFFVALIARAAQQRSGKPAATKKACYVYIDECQSVIAKDTRIPVLLDECRSQKIALILAHQRTAQLTAPVLDAVANCAIRMANSDDEAKYLSSKLRMDTEVLQSLPRGTFGAFIRDLTPQGIQLKVSKVDFDAFPKMTAAEFDAIRARMKTDFASSTPSTSHTSQPAVPAEHTQATKTAPSSQPNTSDTETTSAADPGEPADNW
jgi:hypothetical protein